MSGTGRAARVGSGAAPSGAGPAPRAGGAPGAPDSSEDHAATDASVTPEAEIAPSAPSAFAIPAAPRWSDLRPRLVSAAVMLGIAAAAIGLGGAAFAALALAICCAMLWETARMTAPDAPAAAWGIAALGAGVLVLSWLGRGGAGGALLLVPALVMALTRRRERRLAGAWAAVTMIAGPGLVALRDGAGTAAIVWLVLVVIASDVMGYFAGRTLGGPRFWPAISPKKTWSGTVAGWIGAVAVGAAFWAAGLAEATILLLSPLVAFFGQMGDIAESWLKRRVGVKDSSALIPGHGGVMDRFDAMIGAVAGLMLVRLVAGVVPQVQ